MIDSSVSTSDIGAPAQLTRAQVARIAAASAGEPIERVGITIRADGAFDRELLLRENDVFLLLLEKRGRPSSSDVGSSAMPPVR